MSRTYWVVACTIMLITLAASAALYPSLPDRIPTHWNARGEVDAYGSKTWATFLMPAVMVLMLGLFAAMPWLSPKRYEVDSFRPTYLFVMVVVIALFGYIHALTLYAALHGGTEVGRALVAGVFLFFAVLGNVLGRVRPNFYIGVRTPWTLASERVWTDTHRLAAWLFVAGGLVGFVLALLGYVLVSLAVILVIVLLLVGYSLWLYKRLERQGQL